jgi:hypothetical protein
VVAGCTGADLCMLVEPSHAQFLVPRTAEIGGALAVPGNLVLHVRNSPLLKTRAWRAPLWVTEIWERLDEAGLVPLWLCFNSPDDSLSISAVALARCLAVPASVLGRL